MTFLFLLVPGVCVCSEGVGVGGVIKFAAEGMGRTPTLLSFVSLPGSRYFRLSPLIRPLMFVALSRHGRSLMYYLLCVLPFVLEVWHGPTPQDFICVTLALIVKICK